MPQLLYVSVSYLLPPRSDVVLGEKLAEELLSSLEVLLGDADAGVYHQGELYGFLAAHWFKGNTVLPHNLQYLPPQIAAGLVLWGSWL